MTSPKRPKLGERGESDRTSDRDQVRIPCICRIGEQAPEAAFITDISTDGCRLLAVSVGVTRSAPVALQVGEEAPVAGRLQWIKHASLGVAFDPPLAADVVERMSALVAPTNVIPLKRARFG
jgi:hypothetical protein